MTNNNKDSQEEMNKLDMAIANGKSKPLSFGDSIIDENVKRSFFDTDWEEIEKEIGFDFMTAPRAKHIY